MSEQEIKNEKVNKKLSKEIISLHNVGLAYKDKWVLKNVDFALQKGEFVAVLGDSGCGKSSLLKLIAGFIKASEGEILFFHKPHTRPDSHIGVMFQDPPLYPWLSISQNVGFSPKMRHLPKSEIKQKVAYYLESVGLTHKANAYPYECSGGMRSRAQLAQVLAGEPKVILMDEPFSALDAFSKRSMQDLIAHIYHSFGKSIFFITHDIDEALRLANRIIVLKPYAEGKSNIAWEVSPGFNNEDSRRYKEYEELKEHLYALIKEKYDYVI